MIMINTGLEHTVYDCSRAQCPNEHEYLTRTPEQTGTKQIMNLIKPARCTKTHRKLSLVVSILQKFIMRASWNGVTVEVCQNVEHCTGSNQCARQWSRDLHIITCRSCDHCVTVSLANPIRIKLCCEFKYARASVQCVCFST